MLFSHFLLVSLPGCFLTNILYAFLQRHKFISTYLQCCMTTSLMFLYYLFIFTIVSFIHGFQKLANFNNRPSNCYTFSSLLFMSSITTIKKKVKFHSVQGLEMLAIFSIAANSSNLVECEGGLNLIDSG